jgi:hypothetical protein
MPQSKVAWIDCARGIGILLAGLLWRAFPLLVVRVCDLWRVRGLFATPRFVNELLK